MEKEDPKMRNKMSNSLFPCMGIRNCLIWSSLKEKKIKEIYFANFPFSTLKIVFKRIKIVKLVRTHTLGKYHRKVTYAPK